MSATEVDFCRGLREWAESLGFAVHPEVSGWDLVLVPAADARLGRNGPDVLAGDQVGIHAKLRANCDVLAQAATYGPESRRPRHPYVAVPEAGASFRYVARRLGIGVIVTDPDRREVRKAQHAAYPGPTPPEFSPRTVQAPTLHPGPQLTLPPIACRSIVAGAPSPRQLSPWRVKALRFLAFARARDVVTASQLMGFGLHRQWVERWLDPVDWTAETNKRRQQVRVRTYRLTANREALPDWGYRDVYEEMAAGDKAAQTELTCSPASP